MMRWIIKRKTFGWIVVMVWVAVWGYFNRLSCVKETMEPISQARELDTISTEPILNIHVTATISSILTTGSFPSSTAPSELTRFPPVLRLQPSQITQVTTRFSPLSKVVPRLQPSPIPSEITLPPSDSASLEDNVRGRLRVNHRKALLYGKPRKAKSYLTIGIPTIRREGVDYLEKTIYSLITNSDDSQKKSMVLVIFIVDTDQTWTRMRSKQLASEFPKLITDGFLQIVHPHDQSIYPNFRKVKRTLNDTTQRVAWRSKQNIDYAYLFSYCQNISTYYLHLEDDVISSHNYYRDIVSFINSNSLRFWYYLEFSHIGFIGKLLRSSDLGDLSDYLMLFFAEQPCDLLLLALRQIKTQPKRIIMSTSLFQHMGIVSSLQGKTQKIRDKRFKDSFASTHLFGSKKYPRKIYYHTNPSANIDTNIEVYSYYKPVYAYDLSDDFFWGVSPRKGDTVRVIFPAPLNISRIFIDTGMVGKDTDILHKGELLVSSRISNEEQTPCQNVTRITDFVNGDVDTGKLNISLPVNIDCIVIEVLANQTDWLVVREIAVFLPGQMDSMSNLPSEKSSNKSLIGMHALKKYEKSLSFKTHFVANTTDTPNKYSGQVTVFNIRGRNKHKSEQPHQLRRNPYPSYREVTDIPSVKSTGRYQATYTNQITLSTQHPFKQNNNSTKGRNFTQNNYIPSGLNSFSPKKFNHTNPPATIYTQIESFSDYKPMCAYDLSESFFWGTYPKRGDYFLIVFKSPQNISRIYIDSGYEEKGSDIIQNARLLISTRKPGEKGACQNVRFVTVFVDGDVDTMISNISLPLNIDCIVIEITANQKDWIIIREIAVFLSEEPVTMTLGQNTSSSHSRQVSYRPVQRLQRNDTIKRPFPSKPSFQTKPPDTTKSYLRDTPIRTDSSSPNPNHHRKDVDQRPQVLPNYKKITMKDDNDFKQDLEKSLMDKKAKYRNKLLKNQQTAYSRMKYSEDKNIQQNTSSVLQQNNRKLSNNIIRRKSVIPWETSSTVDKTTNVTPVPDIVKTGSYTRTLEHRKEQIHHSEKNEDIASNQVNNQTDKYSPKKFYHINPSANISTNIETFAGYKPMYAYDLSDTFFWGTYPKRGDYFLIVFKSPQNISRIYIDSGYEGKESDIIQNARLLISTRKPGEKGACQNVRSVTVFVNGDVDTRISNISLPLNIDCIVIEITANQNDWIIIREIAVFLSGEPVNMTLGQNTSLQHLRQQIHRSVHTLQRHDTSKRSFPYKPSLESFQTKSPNTTKSHLQNILDRTGSRSLNSKHPSKGLEQRPQVVPNHKSITKKNHLKKQSEKLFVKKKSNPRNKPLKDGYHHPHQ